MKNIYFILFVLLAVVSSTNAQTISRKAVSNGGGTLSGGESQITFTIGETFGNSSAMLTSGFQQPGESIRIGVLSSSLCSGSTFNLPYTGTDIGGGNTFTAQLSSATGSFANPIAIGTLAGNVSSAEISVTIPYNVIPGNGYRIRITSSSPAYIGADNGTDISILEGPNVGNIIGAPQICVSNQTVQYTTSTNDNRGSWSSSNPLVATINNGGGLKALAPGTTTISYSIDSPQLCGPNTTEFTVTVLASPIAGTISGPNMVCVGTNSSFNSNGNGGGIWSSSDTTVATVNSAGLITSGAPGTTTISYTVNNDCGSDSASRLFMVLPAANAGVISGAALCIGTNTIYTSNGNTGGVWSSNNTARATVHATTGVVTPIATGLVTITYSVNNGACSASATKTMTVSGAPNPGTLSGATSLCLGTTITITRTGGVTGGVWSSSNTAIATISTTGVVTPVTPGTVTMFYTVTNAATCSASASRVITVNALPNAGTITSATTLCIGTTTLFSSNGNAGGVWRSNNTAIATVNTSTGVVTPVAAGSVTITYTVSNGICTASASIVTTVSGSLLTINCPTGSMSRSANSSCQYSIVGTEFNATATNGGCTPITYAYSLTGATTKTATGTLAGVTLNKGATRITCTVTSGALSRTCSITVNVIDTTLPVITACPSAKSIKADKNKCFTTFKYSDLQQPSFTDNCSGAVLSHNLIVASNNQITLPIGVNTVVWSVTDAAGNKVSCNQIITITANGGNCTSVPNNTPITKTTNITSVNNTSIIDVVEAIPFDVIAYPNPSNYQFTLVVEGGGNDKVEILVYDMSGRLVKRIERNIDQSIQFGEELPAGSYTTVISQGENRKTIRLIKK